MRTLLILIVILVIAVIAGDRVAVVMAQNEIGRKIASEYNLPNQPSVAIGGYPFLTQAVAGKYGRIDIRIGDWSQKDMSVRDLDVVLKDVSASLDDLINNRTSNLVASTATATAVIPYETVQRFAPKEVESFSFGSEGLSVKGKFPVAGVPVPATVVASVAPTDSGIEVTPESVRPVSGGPSIPLSLLRQSLTFTVPLQQLPLGAKLTAITPASDGLHVTAEAPNVRFSNLPKLPQSQ
ncbi:DUF2993 domain-containing protein [Nocardia sp. ET3-3]|uniref:DUF2993 domain-containing protein n=1 Tax=Nocardia terrae TaxID=2675851 RepID=A0A7K1URE6_9NOCA|nr:DUF2993 domain-containing protein [Nocardia terrae]MVU76923.1 DUF2993 domain-containing protein [Nocardia terrae]